MGGTGFFAIILSFPGFSPPPVFTAWVSSGGVVEGAWDFFSELEGSEETDGADELMGDPSSPSFWRRGGEITFGSSGEGFS